MEWHALRGGGKRPQFRNANLHLAAWLPSRLAAKKSAFTLAEVLITLGIIGVVAAITLPTLIQNYQKQVWVNQLKKTYSTLNEGYKQMVASEGCTTLECADISTEGSSLSQPDFRKVKAKEKFVKTFKLENVYVGDMPNNSIYNYKIKAISGEEEEEEWSFSDDFVRNDGAGLVGTTSNGEIISFMGSLAGPLIIVDINGLKSPNTVGRDIFVFSGFDFNDTAMVTPFYSKKWVEAMVARAGMDEFSEEERIQVVNGDDCTNGGMTCAEKIIMDGWKMNY